MLQTNSQSSLDVSSPGKTWLVVISLMHQPNPACARARLSQLAEFSCLWGSLRHLLLLARVLVFLPLGQGQTSLPPLYSRGSTSHTVSQAPSPLAPLPVALRLSPGCEAGRRAGSPLPWAGPGRTGTPDCLDVSPRACT